MPSLSNLFDRRNDRGPAADAPPPVHIRPAQRAEMDQCLRMILSPSAEPVEDEVVLDFLTYALRRQTDIDRMQVAAVGQAIVWAILPVLSPGKTMLLLAPGALPQHPDFDARPISEQLIQSVCKAYGDQVHLAQILLPTESSPAVAAFQACGFVLLGELIYLQRRVAGDVPSSGWPAGLELLPYDSQTHALFAQTIRRTYEKSLDCPALNGLRDIEDILAGHKATGDFDPAFWFVLANQGQGQGVLLLNPLQNQTAMELVYLGLTPEARGRGFGDALLRQALHCVRRAGRSDLTLAVDGGNAPALRLYHRHGLRRIGSRLALVRDLRQSAAR